MVGFDEAVPGMAELLGGQQAPEVAPPQQEQSGMADVLGQAKQGLAANPMIANAMLHTMLSLAAGHNFGSAVANGGRAALMMQAQGKQDELTNRKMTNEEAQTAANNKRADAAETRANAEVTQGNRRLDIADRAETRQSQESAARTGFTQAQTKNVNQKTEQQGQSFGLELDKHRADIARIQQEIASSKDQMATRSLQRQLDQAKLKYADAMYQAELSHKDLKNVEQAQTNDKQQMQNSDYRGAPQEMRQASATGVTTGGGKGGKTEEDHRQDFFSKNAELYTDPKTGQIDINRLLGDFQKVRSGTQTDPNAALKSARDAVKVGEPYRDPASGKLYIRRN